MRGYQRVRVHGFFNWDTSNKWGDFAGHFVKATEHDVFAGALHACALEEVAQARAAETAGADGALLPLDTGDLGVLKGWAVSGTFQRVHDGMRFQTAQFRERQGIRLFDFAADAELPLCWIDRARLMHVIAYEEMFRRRKPGTEVFHGRFQIVEAVRTDDQIFFAWNGDLGVSRPRKKRVHGGCDTRRG